jgi:acyl phosphate:glycerol-3-phosphate acyltransferase
MLGHARPVFLRFQKGGKMVATAGGAAFALAPLAAVSCVAVWLLVFVLTRYASVASIATALTLVVFVLLLGYPWPVVVFALVGSAAIVFSHRQNLRRLLAGTEHRFELRRPRRA